MLQNSIRFLFLAPAIAVSIAITAVDDTYAESVLERSEGAIGSVVKNYRLINQDGEFTPLYNFKGRPMLLAFFYTECLGPCLLINQSLQQARASLSEKIAGEVVTLSVSIDPLTDTPEKLREYGLEFTDNFDNWIFARADLETLGLMTKDLGFEFKKSGAMIEHMNRLTLIGPDTVVRKHFYGTDYDPASVEKAIIAVIEGRSVSNKLSDAMDWALLYCSNYDPVTKTYKIDYFFIASIALQYILIIGTLAYIFRKRISGYFSKILGRGEKSAS